jgi:hypothetical protein
MAVPGLSSTQIVALRLIDRHGVDAAAMVSRPTLGSLGRRGLVRRFKLTEQGRAALAAVKPSGAARRPAGQEASA